MMAETRMVRGRQRARDRTAVWLVARESRVLLQCGLGERQGERDGQRSSWMFSRGTARVSVPFEPHSRPF